MNLLHPDHDPGPLARRLLRPPLAGRTAHAGPIRIRLGHRTQARLALHRRVSGVATPLDKVMRRSAIYLNRNFTSHLSLHALLSAGLVSAIERVQVIHRHTGMGVHQSPRRHELIAAVHHVLRERLVESRRCESVTRIASAAPAPSAKLMRVEQRNLFPRVQLTLVRSLPAAAGVAQHAADAAPSSGPVDAAPASRFARPQGPELGGSPSAAAMALPPQELSRLTDHVIRQLDRRVISYQERNARF